MGDRRFLSELVAQSLQPGTDQIGAKQAQIDQTEELQAWSSMREVCRLVVPFD
jgi:hypothetical protein